MKQPHELYLILGDAFARKAGIDPQALHDACAGLPTSPVLVEGLVGALAPRLTRQHFVLSSETEDSTIRTMRTREIEPPRAGRPMKTTGLSKGGAKLTAALRAAGLTFAEEGRELKRDPRTVAFYCLSKGEPNYRALPRQVALRWSKTPYAVPIEDWPRIAD